MFPILIHRPIGPFLSFCLLGRANKRMLYNRRFVNVVVGPGGKKGGYNAGGALQNQTSAPAPGPKA